MKYGRTKNCLFAFIVVLLFPILSRGLEVHFSPEDGAQQKVVELIDGATKSTDVMMYGFTAQVFAEALVKAHQRGIQVRVLLDRVQAAGKHSKDEFLIEHGINLRIEGQKGIMHNKVAIIDGKTVVTGSYNWTQSAEVQNQENLLVITFEDDEEVVRKYQERFEYLWQLNAPEPRGD